MGKQDDLDLIQLFEADTAEYPKLTIVEEISLRNRIIEGDSDARDDFIAHKAYFAFEQAKQFSEKWGVSLIDCISPAEEGLIKGVEKIEKWDGNCPSTAFLYSYIKNSIYDEVEEKILDSMRKKLDEFSFEYMADNKKEPTVEELAEMMEISSDKIQQLQKFPIRIHLEPISDEDENDEHLSFDSLEDEKNSGENFYYKISAEEIKTLIINTLEDIHFEAEENQLFRKYILYRYGLNDAESHTVTETKNYLGITKSQADKFEKIAKKVIWPVVIGYWRNM